MKTLPTALHRSSNQNTTNKAWFNITSVAFQCHKCAFFLTISQKTCLYSTVIHASSNSQVVHKAPELQCNLTPWNIYYDSSIEYIRLPAPGTAFAMVQENEESHKIHDTFEGKNFANDSTTCDMVYELLTLKKSTKGKSSCSLHAKPHQCSNSSWYTVGNIRPP